MKFIKIKEQQNPLAIDSKQRDKTINSKNKTYSDPNDYQIIVNKYKKLKMLYVLEL